MAWSVNQVQTRKKPTKKGRKKTVEPQPYLSGSKRGAHEIKFAALCLYLGAASRAVFFSPFFYSKMLMHTEISHHPLPALMSARQPGGGQNMENLLITGWCIQYTHTDAACSEVHQEGPRGGLIVFLSALTANPSEWFLIVIISSRCGSEYELFSDQCGQKNNPRFWLQLIFMEAHFHRCQKKGETFPT